MESIDVNNTKPAATISEHNALKGIINYTPRKANGSILQCNLSWLIEKLVRDYVEKTELNT